MVLVKVFIFFVLQQSCLAILTTKPDFVKTCYKNDPKLINCSTEAVQALFDQLGVGVPEINIEPLDPLHVKRIHIFQGDGPVSIDISMNNVTVTGFGGAQIKSNRVDLKTFDFITTMLVPKVRIEGFYKVRGRILVVPIRGQGDSWFEASDLNIVTKTYVNMIKKKGFNFYNITTTKVQFELGGLRLRLNNLFEGAKALEDGTNQYLNNNWRPVAESLRPILTKTIEDILVSILRQLFNNVPADFFLGDLEEPLTVEEVRLEDFS